MIRDRSDFGVRIRRLIVISIRISCRWICNHPFLLGFVCFIFLLYRTCPVLFSLLVYASPVLVCTAVLLGTILSFGQPNIPEIEKESEIVHDSSLFKTEIARDATVVEREDRSFMVERFVNKEKEVLDDENDDVGRLGENQVSDFEGDSLSVDYRPLVNDTPKESIRENQVTFEMEPFIVETDKMRETVEEKLIENDAKLRETGGSLEDMMDNSKDEMMDASPVSPWRPMRHDDDEDDDADRDDSLDSESDGAESSSPDASMTDIIPMLDELHPLLLSEGPNPANISQEGSDAASEGPHRSSSDEGLESDIDSEGLESDIDSEDHGKEGDNENEDEEDEEDEEEEEETKEDKEDESKSAIKWTEDDQKNVMDLGSLELERNQRLENLIARRRARHSMRLMAERNLIDLDSVDIPFNMPPISTARRNPFDLPYDSYDDMGLPPIPGSAPSILVPRRNPFDIPYDPNEEKPDLKGDSFQEEFSPFHPKEPVFRRHESFSVGPSMLGGPRQDRNERLRPFFVLEKLANEGTSYYAFERQLSEVSESKVSSVPDTESVSTGLEEDDKKVHEHQVDRGIEMPTVDAASDHEDEKSRSSEDADFSEQTDIRNLHNDVAEITLGGGESHHEGETSGKIETDDVDHSDNESLVSGEEENIPDLKEREALTRLEHIFDFGKESGIHAEPAIGESEMYLTRVNGDEHHDKPTAEHSFITAQPSLEESELHRLCSLVDDHHHKKPVYDSSPPSASRVPSFSSVSSDNQGEIPKQYGDQVGESADKELELYSECTDQRSLDLEEVHSTSAVDASDEIGSRTIEAVGTIEHIVGEVGLSAVETGPSGQNDSMVGSPVYEDAPVDPSSFSLNKDETVDHREDNTPLSVSSQEDGEEAHEDVKETVDTRASDNILSSTDMASPTVQEAPSAREVEHFANHQRCSPLDIGDTMEHLTTLEETIDVLQDKAETSGNMSVAEGITHEEDEASKLKGQASVSFDADIPIDSYSTLSSGAVEYVETHSFNDEDVPQSEQDQGQSSISDTKEDSQLNQTMDIEVDSVNAGDQNVPSEETSPSASDRDLTWSDKSVVEQSSLEHSEHPQPTRTGPVSVVFSRNITFHEYHDAEDTTELSCLTSDSSSPPLESPEYKTPMVGEGNSAEFFHETVYEELDHESELLHQPSELHVTSQSPPEVINEEADEIKEIDEGLLSELDTIGDFSVKEVVADSEPGPSTRELDVAAERTEVLPVLEARSVEDIQSAFQQIHEGSEIDDVILPSTIHDQLALDRSDNSGKTNSELEIVEARSTEDLANAMNRALEQNTDEQPESPESEEGSAERTEVLPYFEARTVEDIQSAFQQIREGSEIDEVILPSTIQDRVALETSENSGKFNSELEIVEAKSTEDLANAISRVLEQNTDEEPKSPESVDGSAERTEILPVLEARSVEDIQSAFQQIHEGSEIDEVILPSTIQDQFALETSENSRETTSESELEVVEAKSTEDLDKAMKRALEKSTDEEPKLPESEDGAEQVKSEVKTKSPESPAKERDVDNAHVPLSNAREEENEATTLEVMKPSEVSTVEANRLLEERITTEVVSSEREIPPTTSIAEERSSLISEEAKTESAKDVEVTTKSSESKGTQENSGESVSFDKRKKKKKKSKSDSSSSSSSDSD